MHEIADIRAERGTSTILISTTYLIESTRSQRAGCVISVREIRFPRLLSRLIWIYCCVIWGRRHLAEPDNFSGIPLIVWLEYACTVTVLSYFYVINLLGLSISWPC